MYLDFSRPDTRRPALAELKFVANLIQNAMHISELVSLFSVKVCCVCWREWGRGSVVYAVPESLQVPASKRESTVLSP